MEMRLHKTSNKTVAPGKVLGVNYSHSIFSLKDLAERECPFPFPRGSGFFGSRCAQSAGSGSAFGLRSSLVDLGPVSEDSAPQEAPGVRCKGRSSLPRRRSAPRDSAPGLVRGQERVPQRTQPAGDNCPGRCPCAVGAFHSGRLGVASAPRGFSWVPFWAASKPPAALV